MSPEICFTSKTSNCVEFGAEIKCTWSPLGCHTERNRDEDQHQLGEECGGGAAEQSSELGKL